MYWTNFRQPTAHVQQNIFGKILKELCSPHVYASFASFESKLVNYSKHCTAQCSKGVTKPQSERKIDKFRKKNPLMQSCNHSNWLLTYFYCPNCICNASEGLKCDFLKISLKECWLFWSLFIDKLFLWQFLLWMRSIKVLNFGGFFRF